MFPRSIHCPRTHNSHIRTVNRIHQCRRMLHFQSGHTGIDNRIIRLIRASLQKSIFLNLQRDVALQKQRPA